MIIDIYNIQKYPPPPKKKKNKTKKKTKKQQQQQQQQEKTTTKENNPNHSRLRPEFLQCENGETYEK